MAVRMEQRTVEVKKAKYPWLMCFNNKLGCSICKEFAEFKSFKSHNIEMAKEWTNCQIDSGYNPKKLIRLAISRNKIKKHSSSKAHTSIQLHLVLQLQRNKSPYKKI